MAGKSSAIFSVSVSTSANGGGDPDPNTQLPSLSGLTFTPMATTSAAVDSMAGAAELVHEEEHSRSTPGQAKVSAVGIINTTAGDLYGAAPGDFIRVMYPDEISAQARFRTSAGAVPTTHAYGKWLASGMALYSPSAATTTTANAGQGNGTTIVIDEAETAKVVVGAPIRRRTGLIDEYAIVTAKAVPGNAEIVCTVHPAFSSVVASGQVITLCYAFYPTIGYPNTVDFHCLFDMGGPGTFASGGPRSGAWLRCVGFPGLAWPKITLLPV